MNFILPLVDILSAKDYCQCKDLGRIKRLFIWDMWVKWLEYWSYLPFPSRSQVMVVKASFDSRALVLASCSPSLQICNVNIALGLALFFQPFELKTRVNISVLVRLYLCISCFLNLFFFIIRLSLNIPLNDVRSLFGYWHLVDIYYETSNLLFDEFVQCGKSLMHRVHDLAYVSKTRLQPKSWHIYWASETKNWGEGSWELT